MTEHDRIKKRYQELITQSLNYFPEPNETLNAPTSQGVYVIRKGNSVLHVGRTLRGRYGLKQRLQNHLEKKGSSFTIKYLKMNGAALRKKIYTYQYLAVKGDRERALLEAYTIGVLCPKHIGLGV